MHVEQQAAPSAADITLSAKELRRELRDQACPRHQGDRPRDRSGEGRRDASSRDPRVRAGRLTALVAAVTARAAL